VIARLAKPFTLAAVVTTFACCAAPPPAAAINPAKPICALAGLISGLAGKICSAASHPGRVLDAGKKLLTGHLGGALKDLLGSGSSAAGKAVTIGAIALAVVAGARFVMHETAAVISSTTRPELESTWFSAFYWRMAAVAALLTLPFLFAAAIQALIRADLTLLTRSAFGYLPLGLLAVSIASPLTMLLLSASDELSHLISSAAGNADILFLDKTVGGTAALTLFSHSPFVAFFVGLLAIAATMVLWCELLIRAAAVYVIVLMLPVFFAALVWPARRVWAVRAVELLFALILAKFAIVAVLALGGAAIGHTLFPSVTSMLAGATLVLLAAFSPWALLRLLPLHELAAGAVNGLRMAPGQQLAIERGRADAAAGGVGEQPQAWLATADDEPAQAAHTTIARLGRPSGRDDDTVDGTVADVPDARGDAGDLWPDAADPGDDGLAGGAPGAPGPDGGGGMDGGAGPDGAAGPPGAPGDRGPSGAAGPDGPSGPDGAPEASGPRSALDGLTHDPRPPVDPGFHAGDNEWDTLHLHENEDFEHPVFGDDPDPLPPRQEPEDGLL
jgi:hypothetical protein